MKGKEKKTVISKRKDISSDKQVEGLVENHFRGMRIRLKNDSVCTFSLLAIQLQVNKGKWLETPPPTIFPGDNVRLAASSNGFWNWSTSGTVSYECLKHNTKLNFFWNVPYTLFGLFQVSTAKWSSSNAKDHAPPELRNLDSKHERLYLDSTIN